MGDDARPPERPHDLPADLGDELEAHAGDPHALREAIIYAHELLNELHEPRLDIEPGPGEEILEVTDHGEYTAVVRRTRGQPDAFLYHVRREPHLDGEEKLHWVLVGRVDPDDR